MNVRAIKNLLFKPRGKLGKIKAQNLEQTKKIEELTATVDGENDWFTCEKVKEESDD